MSSKKTIFYSWQSDLPKATNLNGIRISLREACNFIEEEIENITIELDEATRDTPGSPNIPKTIFKKISECDIFICDLTTINYNSTDELRKVQNPNVLIELGFAIATVGWDRIIMLFNNNYGTFPNDLPFDIDRHRATSYSIKDKNDKAGKKQLSEVMKIALKTIIEKSPLKSSEKRKVNPSEKKRNLDIESLLKLLNVINIETVDLLLYEAPGTIIGEMFFYREEINEILNSSSFHIYDEKLFDLIQQFHVKLNDLLSYGHAYQSTSIINRYKFYFPIYQSNPKASDKAYEEFNYLTGLTENLEKDFKLFIKYIRENYLEIDLSETSKVALDKYNTYNGK